MASYEPVFRWFNALNLDFSKNWAECKHHQLGNRYTPVCPITEYFKSEGINDWCTQLHGLI